MARLPSCLSLAGGRAGARLMSNARQALPEWLRVPIPVGKEYTDMARSLSQLNLKTICQEGRCPNIGDCWSGPTPTATIMVMGGVCTRACRFCSVKTNKSPPALDADEPANVARAISQWRGVKHVVITSVDRDDLSDGGCAHFVATVENVTRTCPSVSVEILCGDFQGRSDLVVRLARAAGLRVFGHNVETVRRLTGTVRDRRAGYDQSLAVLRAAKAAVPALVTKSSLMLGCGETPAEVEETLGDLRAAAVDIVTIGQYMRPTRGHMPVVEYIPPDVFSDWHRRGMAMGFKSVVAGPLVRSSYKAGEHYTGANN